MTPYVPSMTLPIAIRGSCSAVGSSGALMRFLWAPVRISKIEIIGRNRTNRNSRKKNSPIEPMNIAQSQTVP